MTREATPDVPAQPEVDPDQETVLRDQPSATPEPTTSTPLPTEINANSPTENENPTNATRSRSNSIQAKKDRLIYEIEKDDKVYENPEKPLEDAIEKHQEEDREAYQELIRKNVALSRENKKLTEQCQEQSTQMEVLKVELQDHQERNNELETKLKGMEVEMKALIKAAQKRGISRPQTAVDDENNNREDEIEESDPPEVRHRKQQQKRIRDLQYRLLRMTTDMESKDKRLEDLERRNGELEAMVAEYEPLVDAGKVSEVRTRVCTDPKENESDVDPRGNVIRQNGNVSSSICVVM